MNCSARRKHEDPTALAHAIRRDCTDVRRVRWGDAVQITISPKEEAARGGRLRSRLAQSAIRETLGSSGGPQRKSYVMEPPLRVHAHARDRCSHKTLCSTTAVSAQTDVVSWYAPCSHTMLVHSDGMTVLNTYAA